MRRFAMGILLLAAGAFVSACQTTTPSSSAAPAEKSCPAGRADARAPVVCVDDSDLRDLRVHPEPIELARGSSAQWYTRTGRGNLTIAFDDANAFDVACTAGAGYCKASARAGTAAGSYKYSVSIAADGRTYVLDPTVTLVEGSRQ